MSEKPKLFCDIDGVLADSQTVAIKIANEKFGLEGFGIEHWTGFRTLVDQLMNSTSLDERTVVNEIFGKENVRDCLPIEGAIEALVTLADKYEISAVTSRDSNLQRLTHDWIGDHFGGIIKGVFVKSIAHDGLAGTDFKIMTLAKIRARVHIDDDERVTNLLRQVGGVRPVLHARPWNENLGSEHNGQERLTWEEMARVL